MKKAQLKSMILWVVLFIIFCPVFTCLAVPPDSTYTFTIKDENGAEIGQYFDIRIDSFKVQGDTTVNFQMIPNLGIQDSSLQERYSTFLEMLRRNTANEVEAVVHSEQAVGVIDNILQKWDTPSFNFGNYRYEGFDYDQRFRDIGREINILIGLNIVREGGSSAIKVDYSSREPSKIVVTRFSALGIPLQGVLYKRSFALNAKELNRDIRLAYLRALLLNNDVDEDLLNEDGSFTSDALNVLKTAYTLENGRILSCDENEVNRSPVAIAKVNASSYLAGQPITLIGSDSRDPDGSIKGYSWRQVHGSPKTLEYMSENEGLLTNSDSSVAQFTANWPGNYRCELRVKDDKGAVNKSYADIFVIMNTDRKLEHRIVNLMDIKQIDYSGLESTTLDKISEDTGANFVEFLNLFWYTQIEPLPIITRLLGDPVWQVTDESIVNFIQQARHKKLSTILSESLYPIDGVPFPTKEPKSNDWWSSWFTQIEPILLDQAKLAEQNEVQILNVYYIDLVNVTEPSTIDIVLPQFNELLQKIRLEYSGEIAVTSALGGTPENPFNLSQYHELLEDENIDLVFLNYDVRLFEKDELNPDLDELVQKIVQSFSNKESGTENVIETARRLNKPFILRLAWNSAFRQNEFEWFEPNTINPAIPVDYLEQVRLYEATFEAIKTDEISEIIQGLIVQQYFWNDQWNVFYPPSGVVVPASGHIGNNVRNKPAEKAIKLWFDILDGANQ